jgi:hypothetical protein
MGGGPGRRVPVLLPAGVIVLVAAVLATGQESDGWCVFALALQG